MEQKNRLEFTDEEISREMLDNPIKTRGDFWEAYAILLAGRAEAERLTTKAPENKSVDVIPLSRDEKRLAAAMPGAAEEISSASAEAEAAKQRAEELLAERLAILDGVEVAIREIGLLGWRIFAVRHLTRTDAQIAELGAQAVDNFLLKSEQKCERNSSLWLTSLHDLSMTEAITPHVGPYIRKLEKKVAPLIAELKQTAAENQIDLRAVIVSLVKRDETIHKFSNCGAYDFAARP
jgi:hypothetical protein